jgi:hypothetical protein
MVANHIPPTIRTNVLLMGRDWADEDKFYADGCQYEKKTEDHAATMCMRPTHHARAYTTGYALDKPERSA